MKFRVSIYSLFVLIQFFITSLCFGQGLEITICEGGFGVLSIPDCDDDDECCIVWYDTDLPEGSDEVGRGCLHNVVFPTTDKTFRIVVTKDNFGSVTELTGTVKVINPDDVSANITATHKCYTKGEPIDLTGFEIQSNVSGLEVELGAVVIPSIAPLFDKEVATSIHQVPYEVPSCPEFGIRYESVALTVVNPDKKSPLFNSDIIDFSRLVSKINRKLDKLKFFGICNPYIGVSVESSVDAYTLCCKNKLPLGEIEVGTESTFSVGGELGAECGIDKTIPFRRGDLFIEGKAGLGIELTLAGSIATTCEVGNSRRCFDVGWTPKAFAFLVVDPTDIGIAGLRGDVTFEAKLPNGKYCLPDKKWELDGPICVQGEFVATLVTTSFYIKFFTISLGDAGDCSQ